MDEQEMIETAFDDLIKSLRKGTTEESVKMIRRAFEFAREAHQGVRRKSGEPYILHPLAVAKIAVKEIGLGTKSAVAALLHDVGSLMIPAHIYRKRKNEITPEDEKKIRTYHYAAIQLIDNDYDLDPEIKRCVRGVINDLHDTGNDDATAHHSLNIDILKTAYAYDSMTAMNFEEEPTSEIEAVRTLLNPDNGYDQEVVAALIESINILQPGVCVELSNGDKGLVVAGNDSDVLAPVILSFRDNVLYNMADHYVAQQIQIRDIMKTMDNRYVIDNDLLISYHGKPVHMGEKLTHKNF